MDIEQLMYDAFTKELSEEIDRMILGKMIPLYEEERYLKQCKSSAYNCILKNYKDVENV